MKSNRRSLRIFGLGLILILAVSALLAGCTSANNSATPASTAATSPPAATSPAASATPSTGRNQIFGQGQGASGTLASINGTVLTLTTSQGQVTVNAATSTPVEQTETGSVSDLQVGQFVVVIGSSDASGAIAATTIDARSQGQGQMITLAPGATPGSRRMPTPNPTSTAVFLGGNGGTIGSISAINGNTLTLTATQGQLTVNIGPDTVIQQTFAGTLSDLQVGDFLTVVGSRDASGNLTATAIVARPQGTTPGGIRRTGPPATSQAPTASAVPSPSVVASPTISSPPSPSSPPSVVLTTTPAPNPAGGAIVTIISPLYNATFKAGDVAVTVVVSNFALVDKIGQPAAAGQGHIIYYLDAQPPTIAGKSAQTSAGTFGETNATSYTWHNVGSGQHTLSVQLVNNDDTPLANPVVMSETVNVQ